MLTRKITGIIIATAHAKEWDRRITVFSREFGKISILAKGVKKITSRRGNHLDLFHHVRMEVEESRTPPGQRYLREISHIKIWKMLREEPECFGAACVIAQFLLHILPAESPQEALYELTEKTFSALEHGKHPRNTLFTYFLKTLRLLGHLPETLPKSGLRPLLAKTLYTLDPTLSLNARRTLSMFSIFESTRSN